MPDPGTGADSGGGEREPAHRRPAPTTRLPVVGLIAVLLAAGLVAGRPAGHHDLAPAPGPAGPAAAPAAALSSSWFCAGATGTPRGRAPGTLVITNAGIRAVTASVTLLGSNSSSGHRTVVVGPAARLDVAETVASPAPWTGAIVDVDGGAVTVEQQITGILGLTAAPCATAGSATWYFPSGATLVNATSEITLLNPYPSSAIVNLGFTTDQGQETPDAFEGILVPAGHLVAVDLGSHLRRRSAIATTVTANLGRVVAWQTEIISEPTPGTPLVGSAAAGGPDADPAAPGPGVITTLGAPAPQTTWWWPEGTTGDGVAEQYVIYNPGPRPARLALAVTLDDRSAAAEPLDLTVGPQATTTLVTGLQARIPPGAGYSAMLTSRNGVPVVAERAVVRSAPAVGSGTGELLGSARAASSWLAGAGQVSIRTDEVITVVDPGRVPVRATLQALVGGRLQPLPGITAGGGGGPLVIIPAGGRVAVDLGAATDDFDAAVIVHGTGPVIVERDLYGRRGVPGVSLSLAVPLLP